MENADMTTTTPPETAGLCLACLTPTDTVLGFRGDAEFHVAAVMHITKESMDDALATYRNATGADPDKVIDGVHDVAFRLCEKCASRAKLPRKPVLLTPFAEIPTFVQPAEAN